MKFIIFPLFFAIFEKNEERGGMVCELHCYLRVFASLREKIPGNTGKVTNLDGHLIFANFPTAQLR